MMKMLQKVSKVYHVLQNYPKSKVNDGCQSTLVRLRELKPTESPGSIEISATRKQLDMLTTMAGKLLLLTVESTDPHGHRNVAVLREVGSGWHCSRELEKVLQAKRALFRMTICLSRLR